MPLLGQTSRAVFYHLPMWLAMYTMLLVSLVYSIRFLRSNDLRDDVHAREAAKVGIFFGLLGLSTGILWSRVAWYSTLPDNDFDAWWSWDPKQTSVLVAIIIFAAYLVLRNSVDEMTQRARLGAVYNIFAFVAVIALTYIIPRQMESLHPGSDAQPGADTSFAPAYRLVLYPAFVGFARCWPSGYSNCACARRVCATASTNCNSI